MKQTAVEWLESEIKKIRNIVPKMLFEKAKQMEKEELKQIIDKVTRFEVIDKEGRQYVIWNTSIELSLQDDGQTLKVFVNN